MTAVETYTPRLKVRYYEEVRQQIAQEVGMNIMAVPRLEKIVVNMGVGDTLRDSKTLDEAVATLALVTGQKPLITKARKSIAGFKLREGVSIGAKVTLRGDRMWEFFDRLLTVALPRTRDFRGLSAQAFDGRGNYTLGIADWLIFPEVDYDKVSGARGMDVTIVTTARSDDDARKFLEAFGFPFKR